MARARQWLFGDLLVTPGAPGSPEMRVCACVCVCQKLAVLTLAVLFRAVWCLRRLPGSGALPWRKLSKGRSFGQ